MNETNDTTQTEVTTDVEKRCATVYATVSVTCPHCLAVVEALLGAFPVLAEHYTFAELSERANTAGIQPARSTDDDLRD